MTNSVYCNGDDFNYYFSTLLMQSFHLLSMGAKSFSDASNMVIMEPVLISWPAK